MSLFASGSFRLSGAGAPVLIVDDVLTTGASMEKTRGGREAVGLVLFARGPLPPWVRALFVLDEAFR